MRSLKRISLRRLPKLRPFRLRLRVLPLAIFAMGGLLVLKSAHLIQAAGGAPAALASASRAMVPQAQAASHSPAKEAAPKDAPAAAAPAAPPAEPPVNEAERALLLDLRARRTVLEAREQALANREAT